AVAAPLSVLTKGKTSKFLWSSEAEEAFKELKQVDASDVGVGAILSQQGVDNKLHLCTFLSHRLTPAESGQTSISR
ncbi:hypothetical protein M9458_015867, partial [Cirrhinus mrigala]